MDARSRVFLAASVLASLTAAIPARADTPPSRSLTTASDAPPPAPIDEPRPARPRDHVELTVGIRHAKDQVADTPAAPEAPPPPPPIDEARPGRPRDHVEFTMGFLGGQRAYDALSFGLDSGTPAAQIQGANKLTKPFTLPPYNRVNMVGLRYEARVHIAYARMTAGFDLPFSVYNQTGTSGSYDVGGTMRTVTIQSLSAKEAHFGLGAEVPIGRFVPFVDLLGGVHWVNTDLAIDQTKGSYASTSFAMTLRGGARIYMRRWFFAQAAGEVGLVGDLKWNAELSVGAALPW